MGFMRGHRSARAARKKKLSDFNDTDGTIARFRPERRKP
jgi:hypothetical protein